MDIITIIGSVLAAVGGVSGIVALVTIRETKKGKQLDNAEKEIENKDKEQEIHLKLIDELQEQIDKLNTRLDKKDELLEEKNDQISDLRSKLDKAKSRYIASDVCRCVKVSCQDREPSWSSRLLDVNKLVEDSEN